MTSDLMDVISFILGSGYQFLVSFNIPLTNFTPLAALFFVAFFTVSLRFIMGLLKSPAKIRSPFKKTED